MSDGQYPKLQYLHKVEKIQVRPFTSNDQW